MTASQPGAALSAWRSVSRVWRLLLLLCLADLGLVTALAKPGEAATFSILPAPAWVRAITPPDPAATRPEGEGIDYLLVDNQENVGLMAAYYHEARSIYSENGVQNGSALTVSFDPTYQKLVFHTLKVTRKGRATDRLDRSRIKLFQRESEMDAFLYDGNYTAQCALEDIRVGDIIEFSYSVIGGNPVMQGHYADFFATNWSTPVHRSFIRILYPSTRKLYFASRNKDINPRITTAEGKTEWVWDESEIAPQLADGSLPTGYSSYGAVQISDFATWSEVVAWALPLYDVHPPFTPELQAEIEVLRAIADPDQRVLAALRFVQDEIRYLGIEIGIGSHQPTPPGEVLRRRFGDCKDKTQLLAALLHETGIAVAPALVSTGLCKEVAHRLPSATVFNHVILQVTTPSGVHWLDSTRSQQRGPLAQIAVGDYGYALVIRAGEKDLTPYAPPPASLPKTHVVEAYRIGAPGQESFLDVTTEYRGASAERNRSYHREHVSSELDKQYLKYYAKRYPGVQIAQPHGFSEMPGEAGCTITEHYRIPDIWILNEAGTKYTLALDPSDLDDAMGDTTTPQRDDPLGVNHPVNFSEEIRAEMFQNWAVENKPERVINPFFHFEHHPQSEGKKISFAYSFQTQVDRISVADVATYNTALRKVKDSLGYTLSYSTAEQIAARKAAHPEAEKQNVNWLPLILIGLLWIVVSLILLVLVFTTKSRVPPPLPVDELRQPGRLEGIGGWLLLVALGVILRPVFFFSGAKTLAKIVFDKAQWENLTVPGQAAYHPLWQPGLLFELTFNCLGISFALFVAILFFRKRALLPRCLIGLFAYCAIGSVLDYILCLHLPVARESLPETLKTAWQNVSGAALWIPYLLISQRVKNTFRR